MALVKCKECGTDVSTKSKACPKCGAKPPKKTSVLTWVILAVVLVAVYNSYSSDTDNRSPTTNTASEGESTDLENSSDSEEKFETAQKSPQWSTFESSDEMTGDKSSFAISPKTRPTREMGFPYHRVESQLAVGCDGSNEWAYLHFTQAPNLNNTETKDGYNLLKTRVRWDESVVTERMTQDWGAEFIHFRDKAAAIRKIAGANSVMVELEWHGEGAVRFPFTLNGSSSALQEIRNKCSTY